MTDEELTKLLHQARVRNASLRITGMLLYKNGGFIQVIEGPEKDINDVYLDIEADARHHHIKKLRDEHIPFRHFPDWSMGFKQCDKSPRPQGHTRFIETGVSPDEIDQSIESYSLLSEFKAGLLSYADD